LSLRVQEYGTAKDILTQLVFYYSQPATRSLPATAAALETMGLAFLLLRDWESARSTLEQCRAVGGMLAAEQPSRPGLEAEGAKALFLLSVVYRRLELPKMVRA
jgi:hypothetical protein